MRSRRGRWKGGVGRANIPSDAFGQKIFCRERMDTHPSPRNCLNRRNTDDNTRIAPTSYRRGYFIRHGSAHPATNNNFCIPARTGPRAQEDTREDTREGRGGIDRGSIIRSIIRGRKRAAPPTLVFRLAARVDVTHSRRAYAFREEERYRLTRDCEITA